MIFRLVKFQPMCYSVVESSYTRKEMEMGQFRLSLFILHSGIKMRKPCTQRNLDAFDDNNIRQRSILNVLYGEGFIVNKSTPQLLL